LQQCQQPLLCLQLFQSPLLLLLLLLVLQVVFLLLAYGSHAGVLVTPAPRHWLMQATARTSHGRWVNA
jgi:hypothetical protein